MFSPLSPLEDADGRLGLPPLALRRRPHWAAVPGSVALVLVAIGGTTFDGAQEGVLTERDRLALRLRSSDLGLGPTAALRVSNTIFLLLVVAAVAGIFWAGILGMHTVERRAGP